MMSAEISTKGVAPIVIVDRCLADAGIACRVVCADDDDSLTVILRGADVEFARAHRLARDALISAMGDGGQGVRLRVIREKQGSRERPASVAVLSSKGGVGKTTLTLLLAVAFRRLGWSVGILDLDLTGPSIATVLGASADAVVVQQGVMHPVEQGDGIKALSTGYLIGPETGLTWRGPMQARVTAKLTNQVNWEDTQIVIIDTPPGIVDPLFALSRSGAIDAAVVVSTPQRLALTDVRRGVGAGLRLGLPLMGLILNQDGLIRADGSSESLWPADRPMARNLAHLMPWGLMASLPLVPQWSCAIDEGNLSALSEGVGVAKYWTDQLQPLAQTLIRRLKVVTPSLIGESSGN